MNEQPPLPPTLEEKIALVKKSKWKKAGSGLGYLLKGALLFHIATQAVYTFKDAFHAVAPGPVRAAFQERTGIPLMGNNKDIEKNQSFIDALTETVESEMAEMPFDAKAIRVESGNYLEKSAVQQLVQLITSEWNGYADPITDTIGLKPHADRTTILHEIKHIKTFELLNRNPEFKARWLALATDENGDSLYLNPLEWLGCRIRGLDSLVGDDKENIERNRQLGFVTNYARTDFYEDVAELCEFAETESYMLGTWLKSNSPEMQSIIAKIKLAEEYGLIPRDTTRFIQLKSDYADSYDGDFHVAWVIPEKGEEFLRKSRKHLAQYPDSVNAAEIRRMRGMVIENLVLYSGGKSDYTLDDAISEYTKGLCSRYVSKPDHNALFYLIEYAKLKKQSALALH